MHIISFIHQFSVIRKILEQLGRWGENHSKAPPQNNEFIYEPIDDRWFWEIFYQTTTISAIKYDSKSKKASFIFRSILCFETGI
jgi:hypothetical protein